MNGEYYEIAEILPKAKYFDKDNGELERDFSEDEAVEYLQKNLNIDAKFNREFFLDPRANAGEPAVYKRNNKILTHQQVIAEIKKLIIVIKYAFGVVQSVVLTETREIFALIAGVRKKFSDRMEMQPL